MLIAMVCAALVPGTASAQSDCESNIQTQASDIQASDYFGTGGEIDGNRAIIGAGLEDEGGSAAGAVYIFSNSSGWIEDIKLIASDAEANDFFGMGAGLSGIWAAVAAPARGEAEGAIYVFKEDTFAMEPTWDQHQILTVDDDPGDSAASGDFLGGLFPGSFHAVDITSGVIVAGAPGKDISTEEEAGKVFVWRYDSSEDVWEFEDSFTAPTPADNEHFGFSVATDGTRIIVGAPSEDVLADGRAYVYVHNTSTGNWDWEDTLAAPSPHFTDTDNFGWSVDINDNDAMVGSPGAIITAGEENPATGVVFTFKRTGSAWDVEQVILPPASVEAFDKFGVSVGFDGSLAAIGANGVDNPDDAGTATGAGFVYQLQLTNPFGSSLEWVPVLRTYHDGDDGGSDPQDLADLNDRFGEFIMIDGDTAFFCSLGDEPDGFGVNGQHGIVYIYGDLPSCDPE